MDLALVEGGMPEDPEDYSLVRRGELDVYVPKEKTYEGDVPRIIRFQKKNGDVCAGVANEKE